MADIIQQRRDTAARWAQYNPILLEGEVGYVTDNPNQYKIGNGRDKWNDLPLRGYTGTITQETGNDENAVMSQKVVTEKLSELGSKVGINNLFDYKKATEGFYINPNSGEPVQNSEWAISDYIEVEHGKTYGDVMFFYAFYDDEKKYIQGGYSDTTAKNNVNAKYLRFSIDLRVQNILDVYCSDILHGEWVNSVKREILQVEKDIEGLAKGVGLNSEQIGMVNEEVEKINKDISMFSKGYSVPLPSGDDAPVIPFQIRYNGVKYISDFQMPKFENKIYVEQGISEESNNVYKNIKNAFEAAINSGLDTNIIVRSDKDVIFDYWDFFGGEYVITKKTTISTEKDVRIKVYNHINTSEFVSYEGIYRLNTQGNSSNVIDEQNIDEDGIIIPYKKVDSVNAVKAERGTYYYEDGYIYCNPISNISSVSPVFNINPLAFKFINSNAMVWLNNMDIMCLTNKLNYMGHTDAVCVYSDSDTGLFVANNCTFSGSYNSKSPGCGLFVHNVKAYTFDCIAAYCNGDGFNYNHEINQSKNVCVELNCKGHDIYFSDSSYIENASTAHAGTHIIRCGCVGYNTYGPIFADVGSCKSVFLDCKAYNSLSKINNSAFQCDSGIMWIINSLSFNEPITSLNAKVGAKVYIGNYNSFTPIFVQKGCEVIKPFGEKIIGNGVCRDWFRFRTSSHASNTFKVDIDAGETVVVDYKDIKSNSINHSLFVALFDEGGTPYNFAIYENNKENNTFEFVAEKKYKGLQLCCFNQTDIVELLLNVYVADRQ